MTNIKISASNLYDKLEELHIKNEQDGENYGRMGEYWGTISTLDELRLFIATEVETEAERNAIPPTISCDTIK